MLEPRWTFQILALTAREFVDLGAEFGIGVERLDSRS